MKMYDYIRYSHFQLGKSISEISRLTGKNWRTVKKAIEGFEPDYRMKQKRRKPVMEPYAKIVEKWLIEDKGVKKKQRHTGRRIFQRLVEEHSFKGGETTVRNFVNELREELGVSIKEAFIASDPLKRSGAEMDWGEADVDVNGSRTRVYMFCMRAKYSGKIFVKLYPAMVQECFLNGHIEAFAYYGGVYGEVVYDNLSSAVKKVLTGIKRIEQDAFISFRSYYSYSAVFCNRGKGSDKGGVEGLVGYARRNYMTPIPEGKSLDEINEKLLEKCICRDLETTSGQKKTIGELFSEEQHKLIDLPPEPYNNYKLIDCNVDRYLTVKIDKNFYSVPSGYVDKRVEVELGLYDIRITCKNKLIAKHTRNFGKEEWVINPWHHLPILSNKYRAFETSRVRTTIEESWHPIVKKLWEYQVAKFGKNAGSKTFIKTLLYFQHLDEKDMIAVFELALENNAASKESIILLYQSLTEEIIEREEVAIANIIAISDFTLPQPDVSKYDKLMEVENESKPATSGVVYPTQFKSV